MTAEVDAAAVAGGSAAAAFPSGWSTSAETDQLAAAYVEALGELEDVPRSRTANAGTYKYRYADLGDALAQVRPVFRRHNLAVFHDTPVTDGEVVVQAIVMHTSGQWLSGSPVRLPTGNTAQSVGSAITYGRRYTLMAVAGLATEDDDGAAATATTGDLMSAGNVDRFLNAAHDSQLTTEEIGKIVLEATQGRTITPTKVFASEMPALREALARHTASGAAGEQASPVAPVPGEPAPPRRAPRTRYRSRTHPMSDWHSPWWHDRLNVLDDQADRYETPEPPAATSRYDEWEEPRVDSYWDEIAEGLEA